MQWILNNVTITHIKIVLHIQINPSSNVSVNRQSDI